MPPMPSDSTAAAPDHTLYYTYACCWPACCVWRRVRDIVCGVYPPPQKFKMPRYGCEALVNALQYK